MSRPDCNYTRMPRSSATNAFVAAAAAALLLALHAAAASAPSPSPSPTDVRVARLLANMSVAEKARQLMIWDGTSMLTDGIFDEKKAAEFLKGLGAGVLDSLGRQVDPYIANAVQRAVVASSASGIGVIIAEECQHGVQGDWHTMFPSPITMAATFDAELLGEVGRVIGTEARASGITQCWSPVCGLAREPRWGRMEEELGEDTFLAGELAGAMAAGMVGDAGLAAPDAVSPLIKHASTIERAQICARAGRAALLNSPPPPPPPRRHMQFAGYSVPQGGHNAAPSTFGGVRDLLSEYLPVFHKAIKGGAQGVMSSYNEIDGVPTTGDPWLLTDVLRTQLGFDGYVSSDFGAISGLGPNNHAVASNDSECIRQFLVAGGAVNGHDMGAKYETLVAALVVSGAMPEAVLDRAAGDVLRVKARLGLLDGVGPGSPAIVDSGRVADFLGDNAAHVAVALRAARESVVVVENDGTLPLAAAKLKNVLVVGPNADAIRAGDYSAAGWAGGSPNGGGNINNANAVTVLQALKQLLPGAAVTFAPASNLFCAQSRNSSAPNSPLWSTIQAHSFSLATDFSPTAPSSPYKNATPPGPVPAGTRGLAATYFAGGQNGTDAVLTRVDLAPNFHFFALGPDPTRMPNATFRVRWEGTLTPDSTVHGGGLRASTFRGCGAKTCGSRVWLDGALVIDAWRSGGGECIVDWSRGVGRALAVEFWSDDSSQSPVFFLQWSMLSTQQTVQQSIDEAVALARGADVVVAVVGGANNEQVRQRSPPPPLPPRPPFPAPLSNPTTQPCPKPAPTPRSQDATTEGEGIDRASLNLGGTQALLLQALQTARAAPLVTVLMDSKPIADPALDGLGAVLAAFQGGQACGQAIAEVALGVTEPSGRLPISFPISESVLPVFYARKPSGRSQSYCDVDEEAVVRWPFGYGLAYTTMTVDKLVVVTPTVSASDGHAVINCTVSNTGSRSGWAVPQLYLRRALASVTTPLPSLKGFQRLFLAPGDTVVASFSVDVASELVVFGRDLVGRVEPGDVNVLIGFSSAALGAITGTFTIVA